MKRSLLLTSTLCGLALTLVTIADAGAAPTQMRVRPTLFVRAGGIQKIGPGLPVEQPASRVLSLTVNGTRLADAESAMLVSGRVYVPLRSVANALHIGLRMTGPEIELRLPSADRIYLRVNSTAARLEQRAFVLPTPVLALNGRVYLPIHLFVRTFGAVVRYNEQSAQIAILARLQPRARLSLSAPPVTGTISNLDLLSNPASVSLVVDDRVRTIPLRPGTPISTEDLVSGTRQEVTAAALHVGDVLTISFGPNGSIAELSASYRSRNGVIAAVAAKALALADGQVILPSRSTTVTLNGVSVGLSGLHVGDTVTVRSNPDTLEIREIIASRPEAVQAGGSVHINQLTFVPTRPLRGDEELDVFMRGTAGGSATFTIGGIATSVPMREIQPGLYSGRYLVVPGVSFLRAPITGLLRVGGTAAQSVSAAELFSAATLPPQIVETAPADGQVVNSPRASIYASFTTPTGLPIEPASIRISVAGVDVTAGAQRTADFVTYEPPRDLPRGSVSVNVSVADVAGNLTNYHWSFATVGAVSQNGNARGRMTLAEGTMAWTVTRPAASMMLTKPTAHNDAPPKSPADFAPAMPVEGFW